MKKLLIFVAIFGFLSNLSFGTSISEDLHGVIFSLSKENYFETNIVYESSVVNSFSTATNYINLEIPINKDVISNLNLWIELNKHKSNDLILLSQLSRGNFVSELELSKALDEYRDVESSAAASVLAFWISANIALDVAPYMLDVLFKGKEFDPYDFAAVVAWGAIKGVIGFKVALRHPPAAIASIWGSVDGSPMVGIDVVAQDVISNIIELYVNAWWKVQQINYAALKSIIDGNTDALVEELSPFLEYIDENLGISEIQEPTFQIASADLGYSSVLEEGINIVNNNMLFDSSTSSWKMNANDKSNLEATLTRSTIPDDIVLSLNHGNLDGIYSPIDISVNGLTVLEGYDVQQANGGSDRLHKTEIQVGQFLSDGENKVSIRPSEESMGSHYIQAIQLTPGQTSKETIQSDNDLAFIDLYSNRKDYAVGEEAQITGVLYNTGKNSFSSPRGVRMYVNGNSEVYTSTVPVLAPGEMYPISLKHTVKEGTQTIQFNFESTADEVSANNSKQLTIFGNTEGDLLIDGAKNQEKNLTVGVGAVNNFKLNLQNTGSDDIYVSSSKSGIDQSLISIDNFNNKLIRKGETVPFNYSVDATNTNKESLSFALLFSTETEQITVSNSVNIINSPNGEIERIFTGGTVNGAISTAGSLTHKGGDTNLNNFYLDNDPNSTWNRSETINKTFSQTEFNRLVKANWIYDLTERQGTGSIILRTDNGVIIKKTSSIEGDEDILREINSGSNNFRIALTDMSIDGNDTQWEVNESRIDYSISSSIWESGAFSISPSEMLLLEESWDNARLYVDISNTTVQGKAYLFNNGELIAEDDAGGGNISFSISQSEIEETNNFVIKGDYVDETYFTIEDALLEIEYYQGAPNISATKNISKDSVRINENFSITNSLENTGSNNALSVSFNDEPLEESFIFVSGINSEEISEIEPGEKESYTYSLNATQIGNYVFGDTDVSYTHNNTVYSSSFNAISVTVLGGSLLVEPNIISDENSLEQVKIEASITEDLSNGEIKDAYVYAVVTGPNSSGQTFGLIYDEVQGKYTGSLNANQNGSYSVIIYAEKDFYLKGISESITFSKNVEVPNIDFNAEPTKGVAPLSVSFQDNSSSQSGITFWEWDFDSDGEIDSREQNPTYEFVNAGNYNIKLRSGNTSVASTETKENYIIVLEDGTGTSNPNLTVITEPIAFQDVTIGSSRIISYKMSGSNLRSDINIVAPEGFEVALGSENIIYSKELTVPVTSGSINETMLVRFTPTVEEPYDAQIEHTTEGITPKYVSVTGNGVAGAVLSLSASELNFPDVDVSDGDSTVLSYQLLGSGLSSPITINASEIFSVSLSENSGFQTSLSIAQDNGSVEDSIYVRFKPSTLTQYSEELEHTALNADTKTIAVKGNAVVLPDPYLVLPDSPLDFGDVELSKDSVISYNVVGAYLRDSLYVDPSEGFQVSLKPDSDFLDQLSIAHVPDSTIIQRRIYVRFTPSSVQAYDGSINHTTEDVPDEIVSLMGSGVVPSTIEVWPGDANNDGIVSSADILPIGLHYDKNRPGENNPGSEWQMYQRDPWSIDGSVPNAIYADANGDGVVNTREVLTIGLNYGKTHTLSKSVSEKSEFLTSVGVLQIEPEVLSEGVLGMSLRTDSQEDLFGISMKVKVESLSGRGQITNYELDIENSLFGNNLISFDKAMKDGKTFDIAISKKEASTESYHGEIYSLSMNHDFSSTDELLISVEDIVVTNKDGELYKIESEPASFSLGKFDGQDFNDKPKKFSINQNYPNPFNPTTVISFSLPVESEVELSVFSMSGQKVAELVSGRMASGNHKVVFNASNLSSGVYVYRIKAGSFVQTKKLTLIK